MRKVTKLAASALQNAKPFSQGNTTVQVLPNVSILLLHGNPIAYLYNDPERTLSITNAGWFTPTTKERLNGLSEFRIWQKRGKWFLNRNEWDGGLIDV